MPLAAGSAYVGPWIDHSKGTVYGATITIPAQHSGIVVAAVAMLITAASIAFWELFCFVVHHIRSTTQAKDGLFHQQQILLRNGNPPLVTSLRMLSLGFQWRAHARLSLLRALPFSIIGFSTFALFAVSGLFSAKIMYQSDEVLARGKCGFIQGSLGGYFVGGNVTERTVNDVFYQAASTSFREDSAYARACYNDEVDRTTSSCNIYIQPRINFTRRDDETCPFADHACLVDPVSFDTGIFSSKDLGVNTKPEDEVRLRKKLTCVPLNLERYSTGWTKEYRGGLDLLFNAISPDDSYKYYNLGSSLVDGVPTLNHTFVMSNTSLQTQLQAYNLAGADYYPGPSAANVSSFLPDADFNVTESDLVIVFLSNRAAYTSPVNDPWFKATLNTSVGPSNFYLADQPVTAIGCTEQYQFCNGDRCTSMAGITSFRTIPDLGFNKLQEALYTLLSTYTTFMQLATIFQFLRNDLLLANQLTYGSLPLSSTPDTDHWKKEVENLHSTCLAGMQAHGILHAAPGNSVFKKNINVHDFVNPETTPENINLCNNQKFKSSAYASFSVFGLALIASICFTIILLNLTVPPIVGWAQKRWSNSQGVVSVSRRAWIEDDVLQLQRIALEAKGLGPWSGRSHTVPVLDSHGQSWRRDQYVGNVFGDYETSYTEQRQPGEHETKQPLNWHSSVVIG